MTSDDPVRVLIAGGGVAALEAALTLRELAEGRMRVELLAPEPQFWYRPLAVAEPVAVNVDCLGTSIVGDQALADALRGCCPLNQKGIRSRLKLERPIYARTSAYGHFGRQPERDGGFSWERTDLVGRLRHLLGLPAEVRGPRRQASADPRGAG